MTGCIHRVVSVQARVHSHFTLTLPSHCTLLRARVPARVHSCSRGTGHRVQGVACRPGDQPAGGRALEITRTCTCTCACMRVCMHAHMHAYMHTHMHAYMHTHMHVYMHTHMHAYMHTHMHAYMHTHMHAYQPAGHSTDRSLTYSLTCLPASGALDRSLEPLVHVHRMPAVSTALAPAK